jgi:hypothetical protein
MGAIMRLTVFALVAAFILFASAAPVFAQTRTWVSGVGDDANPCSRTAPCKTFAGAISKTATGGEINVLDPGGFGGVTIMKSISIVAEGQTAGVLVSGTNAIVINSATANVTLRGLDFEGLGTSLSAIKILAANTVNIEKCRISGFRVDSASVNAAIDVENTGAVEVVISDTTIWNNLRGISVLPAAGHTAKVVIDRVTLQRNNQGIRTAAGGTLFLSNSVVTQSNSGVVITGTGVVNSFGNNVISGNTTDISNNPLTPANLQ